MKTKIVHLNLNLLRLKQQKNLKSIQKFKEEEFKGRTASPVPSLGDFPDIDEEDPDEDVTGEELLAQIPKSPRSKNDEKAGEWKQIEIVDESDMKVLLKVNREHQAMTNENCCQKRQKLTMTMKMKNRYY